jgi:RNA polymerase sigma factor (sigma-70 family)
MPPWSVTRPASSPACRGEADRAGLPHSPGQAHVRGPGKTGVRLAQDLTQTTFIKVYLSWRRIKHEDPYRYCKQVLLRTYLDHKRLKSSAEVRTDVVPDRPAAADAAELRITLLDALGHLSPRDRAIIVLRYWEDHSVQTVAELLGLSPGMVKMQSKRALASLRVLLGEDEADASAEGEVVGLDAW